jgi:hypothetical protein
MPDPDPRVHTDRELERYYARVRSGVCAKCGRKPAAPGRRSCSECLQAATDRAVARYYRMRDAIFDYYGRECACCGEDEPSFLTIDHKDGGGRQHKRERLRTGGKDLYGWLFARRFPDGYQTLCFNCNCGRYRNGGTCPHRERRAR